MFQPVPAPPAPVPAQVVSVTACPIVAQTGFSQLQVFGIALLCISVGAAVAAIALAAYGISVGGIAAVAAGAVAGRLSGVKHEVKSEGFVGEGEADLVPLQW